MGEEEGKGSGPSEVAQSIEAAAIALEGAGKALLPSLYTDLFQPALKQVGQIAETLVKYVGTKLQPLEEDIWRYEQIKAKFLPTVAAQLKDVPEHAITTPSLMIAGPTLEALRFAGEEPELRTLFARLLATAMDARNASKAHPSFVEMIKQMTPDEARIMAHFSTFPELPAITLWGQRNATDDINRFLLDANVTFFPSEVGLAQPDRLNSALDNLQRMGLIAFKSDLHLASDELYQALLDHPEAKRMVERFQADSFEVHIDHGLVEVTSLGRQFCEACIPVVDPGAQTATGDGESADTQ